MNIGFDGVYATNGQSYNERYARCVVEMLATDYPENNLYLYTPKVTKKTRSDIVDMLHNVTYRLPAPSGFKGQMWRAFGITNCLQPDGIDIYHGLNSILPLNIESAHVPTVVTIHEPDAHSGVGMSWLRRTYILHSLGASLNAVTRVIAYSETTRQHLISRYDVDGDKIDILDSVDNSADRLMEVYYKAIEDFRRHH